MSRDFATAWGIQISLKCLTFIAREKQKGESSLGDGLLTPFCFFLEINDKHLREN